MTNQSQNPKDPNLDSPESEVVVAEAVKEAGLPSVPTAPMQLSLRDAHNVAKVFIKSGLFRDTTDLSQAIVKILAGYELGIGAFAAMRGINIIQGQLALNASLTAALIKRDPHYDYRVIESTNERCELEFLCDGKPIGKCAWEKRDAELAGLLNKDNWKKYPRAMYFSRNLTEGARKFCPHLTMGSVYFPEELDAPEGSYEVGTIEEELIDVADVIEQEESGDFISTARAMIKEGTFTGNDYLKLGEILNFDKGYVMEVKMNHENRNQEGKLTGINWAGAAEKLIAEYERVNG